MVIRSAKSLRDGFLCYRCSFQTGNSKDADGMDDDHLYAVQNALAAEKAGASAIAMHGRTREQMYSGHANWEILKEVADALTIPLMGNGDVTSPQMAAQMLDEVGATAVMMGRAVEGNPWIYGKRNITYPRENYYQCQRLPNACKWPRIICMA